MVGRGSRTTDGPTRGSSYPRLDVLCAEKLPSRAGMSLAGPPILEVREQVCSG
jgi:hypothetical protein